MTTVWTMGQSLAVMNAGIAMGWGLGRLLPATAPNYLGRFLFWVGVPVGIIAFLRHTELSPSLWIAPVVAWAAILAGGGLAWWILRWRRGPHPWSSRTQGSFLLASMVGNTGYIGFPVSLALVGPHYFAWAVFYDMLGSTLGAYGLGVAMASRMGGLNVQSSHQNLLYTLAKNPALWSFGLGISCRDLPLPAIVEASLRSFAWGVVSLSLLLVGMRLSQLSSLSSLKPAILSVGIKMLLVPLLIGSILWCFGITGPTHRVLLLQMAMPPAFATLVISEAYELDQSFAVTALVTGSLGLVITLPVWLWLFSS
ncbi:MAG: AEC family transporter [Kovacikia sp.]